MKLFRFITVFASVVMFALSLPVGIVSAKQTPKVQASISQYAPGQTVYLTVTVSGRNAPYDLQVHWGRFGQWWGGGSGPATMTGGSIIKFVCNNPVGSNDCTAWWSGTLPKGKSTTHQFTVPLTTTTYPGTWPDAISVTGMVDGQPVSIIIPITQ